MRRYWRWVFNVAMALSVAMLAIALLATQVRWVQWRPTQFTAIDFGDGFIVLVTRIGDNVHVPVPTVIFLSTLLPLIWLVRYSLAWMRSRASRRQPRGFEVVFPPTADDESKPKIRVGKTN